MGNCISSRSRNTADDESRDVDSNNILPVAASSGPTGAGTFASAQNVIIANSQLVDVRGNYIQINNPSVSPEVMAPLPPMNHSSMMFTGRSAHLQRLKDHFVSNGMEKRKSFLFHGLGGIGKTQICLKFIEENESLFSDIFWIDASSESAIDLRLRQIAQANNAPPEVVSSAAHTLKWISKKSNWLMVYDNADGGYEVVEKFLPPGNGGNILITSRNFEVCRITEESMEILEMEEEEALSLLSKSARLNYTSEEVQILAKHLISKLGAIPLAIDQAGAYMMACRCSLGDYLEIYAKHHDQLMNNPSFKGASGYGSSTYGTWEISMKEIETRVSKELDVQEVVAAKSATTLYRIIAFLHYENIPEELFKIAAENYKKRNIDEEQKLGLPLSISMLDPNMLFLDKKGEWDIIQLSTRDTSAAIIFPAEEEW
ncbi:P-loop containing nucleoside triphosphate hydrolase protein [Amanita rubescens]|nr:P-loop containing nucleoside triphosphate hydrolase protein [Amanita rubescens]